MDVLTPAHQTAAVVPAWNEVESIGPVVSGLLAAGACCVFVVDPGSADGTGTVAAKAGATVISEHRPGYGRACMSGAEAAMASGHSVVAFLDGDGSCDPSQLSALLLVLKRSGADLVLGSRSGEQGAIAWHARAGNSLVTAFLRARTGTGIRDLPPFKVIRADALSCLNISEPGYGWTVQLVARSLVHPVLRQIESPTDFSVRSGGVSKVSGQLGPSLRAGAAMLREAWGGSRRRGLLMLMAKAPRSGHSKTRIQNELGAEAATEFWTACLGDSGEFLRRAAAQLGLDIAAMAPTEQDAVSVRRLTGLPTLVQKAPGLGNALYEVTTLPAPFTIAISADVPHLPLDRIERAARAMARHGSVVGPGVDGGYYLVGLRRGFSEVRRRRAFLEASMGTAGVLEHTAGALGNPRLLEAWPDLDTVADVDSFTAEMAAGALGAPRLARWAARRPGTRREAV